MKRKAPEKKRKATPKLAPSTPPTDVPEEELVSRAQIVAEWGVSLSTLLRADLTRVRSSDDRKGRAARYQRADVDAWARQKGLSPRSESASFLSGSTVAAIFDDLAKGVHLDEIVRRTRLHPDVIEAVEERWLRLSETTEPDKSPQPSEPPGPSEAPEPSEPAKTSVRQPARVNWTKRTKRLPAKSAESSPPAPILSDECTRKTRDPILLWLAMMLAKGATQVHVWVGPTKTADTAKAMIQTRKGWRRQSRMLGADRIGEHGAIAAGALRIAMNRKPSEEVHAVAGNASHAAMRSLGSFDVVAGRPLFNGHDAAMVTEFAKVKIVGEGPPGEALCERMAITAFLQQKIGARLVTTGPGHGSQGERGVRLIEAAILETVAEQIRQGRHLP